MRNPFPPDLRAGYVLLEADSRGYEVQFMNVEYDREAVIQAVQHANHPAGEYIIRFMRGQNLPGSKVYYCLV